MHENVLHIHILVPGLSDGSAFLNPRCYSNVGVDLF